MASKAARTEASNTLLAAINMELFSEEHVEKCRQGLENLSDNQFVQVMRKAKSIGADPLAGDIYIRGEGEDRITVIATITCMRSYAESTGEYAGDDLPMLVIDDPGFRVGPGEHISCIVVDETLRSPQHNPMGIVYCTTAVYRFVQGQMRRFSHTVTWEDYVPLFEGNLRSESSWAMIPAVMIQKVAEAGALRKAFPKLGALYIEEEMERVRRKANDSDEPDYDEGRFSDPDSQFDEPPFEDTVEAHRKTVERHNASGASQGAPRMRRASVHVPGLPPAPDFEPGRKEPTAKVFWLDGGTGSNVPLRIFDETVCGWLKTAMVRNPDAVLQWFEVNAKAIKVYEDCEIDEEGQGIAWIETYRTEAKLLTGQIDESGKPTQAKRNKRPSQVASLVS